MPEIQVLSVWDSSVQVCESDIWTKFVRPTNACELAALLLISTRQEILWTLKFLTMITSWLCCGKLKVKNNFDEQLNLAGETASVCQANTNNPREGRGKKMLNLHT